MQCTEESLQALEDVDGAATAAEHKATSNFLEACLLLRLVRGRSTLSDGLGALAALAEDRAAALEVKGYESSIKASPLDCKFGSGAILGKCGKCAQAITECASAPNKTKNVTCIKEIGSFAGDCGGCAVNIPEYL